MHLMLKQHDKAVELALENGRGFHVAAILQRKRKTVKICTNTLKTHPKYHRQAKSGHYIASMHAEMNACRFAKPGDTLYVLRVNKEGRLTMARPCALCQDAIKEAQISRCYYTNWEGQWIRMF